MTSPPTTTRAVTGHNDGHSKAFGFIKAFAAHDPTMPLGAILVLLHLYEHRNETTTLKKLRVALKMGSTVASRSLYYWEDSFVSIQIDPQDRRGRI